MSSSPEGNVMPAVRYPDSITLAFSHVFRAKRTDGDPHTATATCTRVQIPLAALHLRDVTFRFSPSTPGDLRLPAGVKMTLAAAAAAGADCTGLNRLTTSKLIIFHDDTFPQPRTSTSSPQFSHPETLA